MWKRVSILILCYNNQEYLKRALTSVLALDYPNLEIIVSDDCSPNGFDAQEFCDYIETYKKDNLQNYIVRREEANVGTVQHITNILGLFTGDFYMTLGADDFIGIPNTVTKMIRAFEESDREEYLVMGNVRVWSKDLERNASYLSTDEEQLLSARNPKALFEVLTYRCCMPAMGILYHRRYLERIGMPDLHYRYTEEWPRFLDMAQQGITPLFLNIIVTNQVKGGVSNGNAVNSSEIYKRFLQDKAYMWDTKVVPILGSLPADVQSKYYARRKQEEKIFVLRCEYAQIHGFKRLLYLLKKPQVYFWAKGIGKKGFAESVNAWCKRWINYMFLGLLFALTWIICSLCAAWEPKAFALPVLGMICGVAGLALILFSVLMLLYKVMWVSRAHLKKLYHALVRIKS